MKIEAKPRINGFAIYCDTDSEYHTLEQLCGSDTDLKQLMKCRLNNIYGKAVLNMNKDYIIIHDESSRLGIIFKSQIAGIVNGDDGKATIILVSGRELYCTEPYADIVKQLV